MSEPVFGIDAARTREEIERWAATVESRAARYRELQQKVTAVTSSAASRDRIVRVTVDSGGALTDLRISDEARRLSGAELAALVMSTIRRAQAGISEQVADVVSATVGDDQATASALVSAYQQRFPASEPRGGRRHTGRR